MCSQGLVRPPVTMSLLQAGDHVVYSKFAGTDLEVAGTEHVLLKVRARTAAAASLPHSHSESPRPPLPQSPQAATAATAAQYVKHSTAHARSMPKQGSIAHQVQQVPAAGLGHCQAPSPPGHPISRHSSCGCLPQEQPHIPQSLQAKHAAKRAVPWVASSSYIAARLAVAWLVVWVWQLILVLSCVSCRRRM
jgi:hypothetical protein